MCRGKGGWNKGRMQQEDNLITDSKPGSLLQTLLICVGYFTKNDTPLAAS